MIDVDRLWNDFLGYDLTEALGIVVASVVMYLSFTAVLHLLGPRLAANPSTASVAVLAVLGALSARAMLGEAPTMLGGLTAITTLILLESLLGTLRRAIGPLAPERNHRSTVVMIEGKVVTKGLRARRVTEYQLMARLREAGIRHREDIALAIVEPRGALTVLRTGDTIDADLLAGVRGAHNVPEHLVSH